MNVMLTCAGRRSYLIDYFRKALGGRGQVFATDACPCAPALADADKGFVVPRVNQPGYMDFIFNICLENRVKLLIPLIDIELPLLARQRQRFLQAGIVPVISTAEVVDLCFDKWAAFNFLKDCGLPVPRTYLSLPDAYQALSKGELKFPLVVKPRWGSGSLALEFPEDSEEMEAAFRLAHKKVMRSLLAEVSASDRDRCVIIQEKLCGQEYNLDIINDLSGNHVCTFAKRKVIMWAGSTDRAVTVADESLINLGKIIGQRLRHVGNLDCDVMVTGSGNYVLELNPRFGGGYPFSHTAGADIPAALLAWARGKQAEEHWLRVRPDVTSAKSENLVVIE